MVTGPAAVVRIGEKRTRMQLDRGACVPEGADETHLEHLASVGLVTPVEGVLAEPAPTEPAPAVDGQPALEDLTVDQLRQYAEDHKIDLQGATRKADLILAIGAAE